MEYRDAERVRGPRPPVPHEARRGPRFPARPAVRYPRPGSAVATPAPLDEEPTFLSLAHAPPTIADHVSLLGD
jgi:hypothetical protein